MNWQEVKDIVLKVNVNKTVTRDWYLVFLPDDVYWNCEYISGPYKEWAEVDKARWEEIARRLKPILCEGEYGRSDHAL